MSAETRRGGADAIHHVERSVTDLFTEPSHESELERLSNAGDLFKFID